LISKLGYLWVDLKRKLSDYKIKRFFGAVEKIVSSYLKVYIIKPSALVDSEDVGFKYIGLYNVKDSSLNSLSFQERLSIWKRIRIQLINLNNCIYFYYNERDDYQPIIFTIWALGEELRIGCFIDQGLGEEVLEKQKTKVNRLFRMFESPLFRVRYNEIERNDYYLSEVILTNMRAPSIYDSIEKQNFVSQIFALMISQNILEYLENTAESKVKPGKMETKRKDGQP